MPRRKAVTVPDDVDSIAESELMYILETLPDCSNEVIHKVYKAYEAAKVEEAKRGDSEPR